MKFKDIPRFIGQGNYACNVEWARLESWLNRQREDYGDRLELDPDFQRAHVWDEKKQIAYVEFILRGGKSARALLWNAPGYFHGGSQSMVLVDGKQRLEAVRKFMRNDLPAFGATLSQFTDDLRVLDCDFLMHVNELESRSDVLRWYLEINSGGVVHTNEEIEKVRKLLEQEEVREVVSFSSEVLERAKRLGRA